MRRAQVVETGGATIATSAQALLNLASQNLLEIGEVACSRPRPRRSFRVAWYPHSAR